MAEISGREGKPTKETRTEEQVEDCGSVCRRLKR